MFGILSKVPHWGDTLGRSFLATDARLIPPDEDVVPKEIMGVLMGRLGILYGTALLMIWLVSWRFFGSAPPVLTLAAPLCLSALVMWRLTYWHQVHHKPIERDTVLRTIAKLQTIGPLMGLAFSFWGLALFPYGDPLQQDLIHYLTIVTALTSTLCLCGTPVASILLVIALMGPSTVALFDVPNANSGAVGALQTMFLAVTGFVAFAYQRDFLTLTEARRMISKSERRLKAVAERETLLASIDPLTGLLNRRSILEYLNRSLEAGSVKLAMIDLDGFKDINDSMGHAEGDYVLREIAGRLATLCSDCLVGRLGGDEFAILYPQDRHVDLQGLMDVVRNLSTPMTHNNLVFAVGASLGYFQTVDPDLSLEACLERADQAMYSAKAKSGPSVSIYGAALDEQRRQRRMLISAVGAHNFEKYLGLAYQPIVDVGAQSVIGVEALARWKSPGLENLSATSFITIAESCGHINAVTLAVISRALRECRAHERDASLFLNISGRDLVNEEVMSRIANCVAENGVPTSAIVFELTETAYVSLEGAVCAMAKMKAQGFRFALDDFGSGQSSLSRIHRLPVDVIKIDGEFIEQVRTDWRCRAAVRTMVSLAAQLDVECVIEGLEASEQVLHIQRLGGRLMQGYFFQRPGTAQAALDFNFGGVTQAVLSPDFEQRTHPLG